MTIEQLFRDPDRRRHMTPMEMNPLTESGALREAQLLEMRVDVLTSTAGLLFDLRNALQLRTGDTAVLVVLGLREVSWSAELRMTARTAWNVVKSEPTSASGTVIVEFAFVPDARLRLAANSAEFFVGHVAGLSDVPPDFTSDAEATIHAGLASWSSPFSPAHAVFLDPTT